MQIEKAWATEQNTTALAVPHMRQRVNVKGLIWPPSRAASLLQRLAGA